MARGPAHLPASWGALLVGTSRRGTPQGVSGLTKAWQRAPLPALLGALHWFEQSENTSGLKGLHCCWYTRALIFAIISSNLGKTPACEFSCIVRRQPRYKYRGRNASCDLLVGIKTSKRDCIAGSFGSSGFCYWWFLWGPAVRHRGERERPRGCPHAGREGWKVVCPNPAACKLLFISFLRLQGEWDEGA